MIALLVTIQVKPGFGEGFAEAIKADARGSVRDEPGCFRFDVLRNHSDPLRFHLYEVYADQAALDAHTRTPHYLKWRSTVGDWLDGEVQRTDCAPLFPSDDGWRRQKRHLAE
jgi:quinol monooxygenase YgiN